jgi:alpha-beta hydrolase superfamily lysophospholipase
VGGRWLLRAAVLVAPHPRLWATALRQLRRLAAPGWWRRPPHLPVPDPGYLAFRLRTMYGDAARDPAPEDLLTYLRWCRAWSRVTDVGG